MTPDGGDLMRLVPFLERAWRPSRRSAIAVAAAAAPATALVAAGCRPRERPSPGKPAPAAPAATPPRAGRVLGATAWATLEAATARILPSDDGPGAREAGVVAFIDAQLAAPFLAPVAPLLQLTAQLLDSVAETRHGGRFTTLAPAQQDQILTALARGELPVERFPQRETFRALHALTLEGFLSDPVHGGNAGMAGWKAIDFRAPALRPGAPAAERNQHHHDHGRPDR